MFYKKKVIPTKGVGKRYEGAPWYLLRCVGAVDI